MCATWRIKKNRASLCTRRRTPRNISADRLARAGGFDLRHIVGVVLRSRQNPICGGSGLLSADGVIALAVPLANPSRRTCGPGDCFDLCDLPELLGKGCQGAGSLRHTTGANRGYAAGSFRVSPRQSGEDSRHAWRTPPQPMVALASGVVRIGSDARGAGHGIHPPVEIKFVSQFEIKLLIGVVLFTGAAMVLFRWYAPRRTRTRYQD